MDVIATKVEEFISENKFSECFLFLKEQFNNCNNSEADSLLISLLRINDLYTIVSKQEIYNLYLRNKHKIVDKDLFDFKIWLTPVRRNDVVYEINSKGEFSIGFSHNKPGDKPGAFSLGFNPVSKEQLDKLKSNTNESTLDDINETLLEFTIPGKINIPDNIDYNALFFTFTSDNEAGSRFEFIQIDKLTEHPFYNIRNGLLAPGNTIQHIFDISPVKQQYIYIRLILNYAFHPEFEIKKIDNVFRTSDLDLSNLRALYGEDYLPTKAFIVDCLRKALTSCGNSLSFEREPITTDSFSFIAAIYRNNKLSSPLLNRMYLFTSNVLYQEYTNIYVDKLKQLHALESDFVSRFKSFEIYDASDLQEFIVFIFNHTVINQIHYKSGYRYFWNDRACAQNPKTEPEVQPYLLNLIESLCELKGLNVTRESAAAEGEIDMLFSCNVPSGAIARVCIELKKAHHAQIATAINSQLKSYLDSQHTKFGIYMVLWFKYASTNKFDMPKKYKINKSCLMISIVICLPVITYRQ